VCGIVASTGGPKALQVVLSGFPTRMKTAVVIVQHIDGAFMEGLVRWLDRLCPIPVRIANDGEELMESVVYVCPAGRYAEVTDRRRLALIQEPVPAGAHCPSGNRLLTSMAKTYGARATGVILTGMGDDGAAGLLAIKKVHGYTVAQDEETSVIFGMPKEAIDNGAASIVLPLKKIAERIEGASR
jgi:two-component system chemotaxis response regulator CheB